MTWSVWSVKGLPRPGFVEWKGRDVRVFSGNPNNLASIGRFKIREPIHAKANPTRDEQRIEECDGRPNKRA